MAVSVDHTLTPTVTSLGKVRARHRATVTGAVRYVEVASHDCAASFTARIADESGVIDCVFLGRRLVPGIEPGARIVAEGMVSDHKGVPTIFNPRYELS